MELARPMVPPQMGAAYAGGVAMPTGVMPAASGVGVIQMPTTSDERIQCYVDGCLFVGSSYC